MGLIGVLRRKFSISAPEVTVLPDEELAWPKTKSFSVSDFRFGSPKVTRDFSISEPETAVFQVFERTSAAKETFEIPLVKLGENLETITLFAPLKKPGSFGNIYVRNKEDPSAGAQQGLPPTVKPFGVRSPESSKTTQEIDLFDLLLPLLLPPASNEFHGELLFPEELYPFQRAGVQWLFESEVALLADDMGLGKTVQAITAFRALVRRSEALQALVVCPKSVALNWEREFERWAPELMVVRIEGTPATRAVAWRAYVGKCHVLVTTYDTLLRDVDGIKGRPFDIVIADEIQRIKNSSTDTSQAVRRLSSKRRWGLTGTPLENRLDDMAAIFSFLKPGLFRLSELTQLSPSQIRARIRPYFLRRRKDEALPELPEKITDTKWLELTESQRKSYALAEKEGKSKLSDNTNVTVQHVFALIQRLKQICNFDPANGESCKLEYLLDAYLEQACQGQGKALVFSQYVQTLNKIYSQIENDYKPLAYTGDLSVDQRQKIEESFRVKDEHKVLLLSLRAGGVGLNLQRANYVLHFDRWWNPAVERQAEDRAHRLGQKETVFVTRLLCQNTIEERIERLIERKKDLFSQVVDELADVNLERVLSEEDLFGLFGLKPPRRQAAPTSSAHSEQQKHRDNTPGTSAVISPEKPFSNVFVLRKILRSAQEYVLWSDPHYHVRGLEELISSIDPSTVRKIRILSGPANVDDRAKRDFLRFKSELAGKSVVTEWRVLRGYAHDRYIITKGYCYNVPPINSLLQGSYSEILETPNRPPFENWWEQATPIEDYKPS